MRITLRQLEAFVTVAKLSSVTATAERMGLSQPAISSLLRELERAFGGTTLLDRSSRTVRLTEAGRGVLLRAQLVVSEAATLTEELKGLQDGSAGTISLACTAAVANSIIPPVLRSFRAEYPRWRFIIHDVLPQELVSAVLNGTADVGIGTVDVHPELERIELAVDRLALVASRGSVHRESLKWAELEGLPTIAMRRPNPVRAILDGTLSAHGIDFRPKIEVSMLSTALALSVEGIGYAIVPPFLISGRQLEGLSTIGLIDPVIERPLSLFSKRGRKLPSPGHRFQSLLISYMGEISSR